MASATNSETTAHHATGTIEISVVVPVYNEAASIADLIHNIRDVLKRLGRVFEILVVDDASMDGSGEQARAAGAKVISHPCNLGNGAAVKTGMRQARGDISVLLDGDGQHGAADIPSLLEKLDQGFDMAVGARSRNCQANLGRMLANGFYNRMATWMTGRRIDDLTSGFRAVRTAKFREFLHLLPNGFSYPTTITMAFFRSGYPVTYVPITAGKRPRSSSSSIRPLRDGMRFLIIILRIGTLYSPMKIFLPSSMAFFLLGLGYYLYTYATAGRFTNMSALLLTTSVFVFLIGLVSEQITQLMYRPVIMPTSHRIETEIAKRQ
ncbi:Glycosyltransferase involved in cell wall bisynthesis [Desulfonatronum thiosulfatophilum]|uniref:Glycosyltransferase involved in cell wall bisynthesis n=1 Tax=Desulfonatronum thiosulfatophilum TaxID=617002 RepID=A0A1G6C0G5_9BACT|nr:glycosyltransferase family 2 protein [Desulfonatronum thiosulfatophilum]SDB26305.1 Glycosyltransferase involved in cell wall bisynthesis [Desulfonatronum thiosulfatophilum]